MEILYYLITGRKVESMSIKLLLRLFLLFLLSAIKLLVGMDWVFIFGLVIIVSDLDAIASMLEKKFKRK